jgi:hypothetical protein
MYETTLSQPLYSINKEYIFNVVEQCKGQSHIRIHLGHIYEVYRQQSSASFMYYMSAVADVAGIFFPMHAVLSCFQNGVNK